MRVLSHLTTGLIAVSCSLSVNAYSIDKRSSATCTYAANKNPPAGLQCAVEGTISSPNLIKSLASDGTWTTCRSACGSTKGCVSYSHNSNKDICQIYSKNLVAQNFAASGSGIKFWNAACYELDCVASSTTAVTTTTRVSSTTLRILSTSIRTSSIMIKSTSSTVPKPVTSSTSFKTTIKSSTTSRSIASAPASLTSRRATTTSTKTIVSSKTSTTTAVLTSTAKTSPKSGTTTGTTTKSGLVSSSSSTSRAATSTTISTTSTIPSTTKSTTTSTTPMQPTSTATSTTASAALTTPSTTTTTLSTTKSTTSTTATTTTTTTTTISTTATTTTQLPSPTMYNPSFEDAESADDSTDANYWTPELDGGSVTRTLGSDTNGLAEDGSYFMRISPISSDTGSSEATQSIGPYYPLQNYTVSGWYRIYSFSGSTGTTGGRAELYDGNNGDVWHIEFGSVDVSTSWTYFSAGWTNQPYGRSSSTLTLQVFNTGSNVIAFDFDNINVVFTAAYDSDVSSVANSGSDSGSQDGGGG